MAALLLDSLEVQRFRAFRHVQISHLGRVNLVVGNNKVGKTSLLEALWLYANQGNPAVLWQILERRGEIGHPASLGARVAERTHGIRHLFYGRPELKTLTDVIHIGAINVPDTTLAIGVGWYMHRRTEEGDRDLVLLTPEEVATSHSPMLRLRMRVGDEPWESFLFSSDLFYRMPSRTQPGIPCVFISTAGLHHDRIGVFWDKIAMSPLKEDVLTVLRLVTPEAEQVSMESENHIRIEHRGERIPCVQLAHRSGPVPLTTLGDGMTRLLDIGLALVNAQNGFVLIDEIERGMHYAMQAGLWRLIFQLARRLHIQVFATTYSWDSIEAFQQAACDDVQEEGMLISLQREQASKNVTAVLYDENRLMAVTREQIEVR